MFPQNLPRSGPVWRRKRVSVPPNLHFAIPWCGFDLSGNCANVNRIKGLLSAQGVFGYEPLRKGRRERLEDLQTR